VGGSRWGDRAAGVASVVALLTLAALGPSRRAGSTSLGARPNSLWDVKVRQPTLDFRDLDPVWADWPGLAHFFNAVGVVPAQLEPFLIKVMRQAKGSLDPHADADLLGELEIFNRQEAQHYRLHQLMNRWVREAGYPRVERFEQRCAERHEAMLASWSLKWLLAYCEGFEALGLMSAPAWLDGRMERVLGGADPRVVALWQWHMAEEYEHRSVVFQVMRRLYGANPVRFYLLRIGGLFLMLADIAPLVLRMWRYLMETAAGHPYREAGRAGRRWNRRRRAAGLLVDQASRTIRILSPRYDPARMAMPENLQQVLDSAA
jgi:predicted metal-dependent hydrolase